MSGPRLLSRVAATSAALACAVLAASSAAAVAAAGGAESPSLKGLVLQGGCPGETGLKNVIVAPQATFLFAPLRIVDLATFEPTDMRLFPSTVEVIGDEDGLKTRHLTPGVRYTKPGGAPRDEVKCEFTGATKEAGEFTVLITGSVLGLA